MKRKILIGVAAGLVIALASPLLCAYWLLYTQSGLRYAVSNLDRFKSIVRIEASGVRGDLAGGFQIDRLVIDHERVRIVIDDASSRIQPQALLLQRIRSPYLSIAKVRIELRPNRRPPSNRPLRFLPSFLQVAGRNLRISRVDLVLQNQFVFNFSAVRAAAQLTSRRLSVAGLSADGGYFTAAGTIDVGAANPITLAGDLDLSLVFAGRPPWRGRLHARGDLDELPFEAVQTAPIDAQISGRARALTKNWNWQASIAAPTADLERLVPAVKIATRDLWLYASGDRSGFKLDGRLTPTNIPTGPLRIATRGPYPTRRWQIDAARVSGSGDLRVDAAGVMNFLPGGPDVELRGRIANFRWPMLSKPVVTSPAAGFTLSGPRLPYRFTLSGAMLLTGTPPFDLSAGGALDRDEATLDRIEGRWLDGTLKASGRVGWSGRGTWSLRVDAANLDPGVKNPDWRGRLAAAFEADGVGLGTSADVDLRILRISGSLRGQTTSLTGGVQRRGKVLTLEKAALRFGDARLNADGALGGRNDLRLMIDAPHLARILPGLEGSLNVQGRIVGPGATAHVTSTIDGRDLKYGNISIQRTHTTADIDLSDSSASRLDLRADGVHLLERDLGNLEAQLAGRASSHRLTVSATRGLIDLHSRFDGAYSPRLWKATIGELSLRNEAGIDAELGAPAELQVSLDTVALAPLCLLGGKERVCVEGHWQRDGAFRFKTDGRGFPLTALGAKLPTKPEYRGSLSFDADWAGHTWVDSIGRAAVDLTEGELRYKLPSGKDQTLLLGNGHAEIRAESARIDAGLHIAATDEDFLDIKMGGTRAAGQAPMQTPVTGEAHARAHELGFLPLLVPQIDRAKGTLTASLTLSGSLSEPRLDGSLILDDGEIDLYQTNLLMRNIAAQIDIAGTTLQLAAGARIGEGDAKIAGKLLWAERKPVGEIKLTGEKLTMLNIPELRADASPDLNFKVNGRRIDVGGTVTIPYARIKPANLAGAVLASSDEVIVGEENAPDDERLLIYSDVNLVLGKDVTLDAFGLTGRLAGSVSATSDPSGKTRGSGEIAVEEGKYAAYGRLLDIQRGKLFFNGSLVSDPAVDLRAIKVFPEVTAGVNVRGKLRTPQISFFSDPSLPQAQIVSVLLAGGTIESSQTSGTQQSSQTRNELLAQGGAIFAQQIGSKIGVEGGLESDQLNQTSLVLGKFLNPRLYISYGISLTESINTIKLRYTLGDHWTIKTEAGQNRSSDLVYTIER